MSAKIPTKKPSPKIGSADTKSTNSQNIKYATLGVSRPTVNSRVVVVTDIPDSKTLASSYSYKCNTAVPNHCDGVAKYMRLLNFNVPGDATILRIGTTATMAAVKTIAATANSIGDFVLKPNENRIVRADPQIFVGEIVFYTNKGEQVKPSGAWELCIEYLSEDDVTMLCK